MIKPIETRYAGCNFRSRLEARWAVFFDHLGVAWDYEPQGFDLPSGAYLPDFWLPRVASAGHIGVWFEVKPETDMPQDARHRDLVTGDGSPLIVAFGMPRRDLSDLTYGSTRHDSAWMEIYMPDPEHGAGWDNCRAFCQCPKCSQVGIEFNAMADRLPCTHNAPESYSQLIDQAYVAARSARFEHHDEPVLPPEAPTMEAWLDRILARCPGLETAEGRVAALRKAASVAAFETDPSRRASLAARLAPRLGIHQAVALRAISIMASRP